MCDHLSSTGVASASSPGGSASGFEAVPAPIGGVTGMASGFCSKAFAGIVVAVGVGGVTSVPPSVFSVGGVVLLIVHLHVVFDSAVVSTVITVIRVPTVVLCSTGTTGFVKIALRVRSSGGGVVAGATVVVH